MNELVADCIPVAVTCRVLDIARQPYYRWRARPVTVTEFERAHRANALFDAHRVDPEFRCKKRGRNGKKTGLLVHDDLVHRDFTATAPNRLWLADITGHRTTKEKLNLCAVKDACANLIADYYIDSRMKSRIAVTALTNALARRGDEVAGCIVHTDRGSQFRSRKFVRALVCHSLSGSMGRVGAAGDNATMESFFALLQNNVPDRRTWTTREELHIAIMTWIEACSHTEVHHLSALLFQCA